MTLPLLAIASGDPTGIGPEVLTKALAQAPPQSPNGLAARVVVLGSVAVMAREPAGKSLKFHAINTLEEARFTPGVIDVLEGPHPDLEKLPQGKVHAQAGKASVEYVMEAGRLALNKQVDAVVTGPIHKEAVQAGGFHQYIGNTEILEDLCSQHTQKNFHGRCMTMLITKNLRVAHAIRHVPFKDIVKTLTEKKLEETIRLTCMGMASLGVPQPKVAVAGLNPHNGESGMIGREEVDLITPLIKRLAAEGLPVVGPVPADSIFFKAIAGDYDAVVALYHDQGHIAIKVHGFEESITISLGLPIIRTSVDHGTGFDITGKGTASPKGMQAALSLAIDIVNSGCWSQGIIEPPPL